MKVQLTKYGNRKLYSRTDSCYVNLKEVSELIRNGADVTVTCARTKNDVTDAVLAQAVLQKGITRQTAINLLREVQ